MNIINKKIIGLATLFFALFAGLTALADQSAVYELDPTNLETGFTGTVNNCDPLTVENGTVAPYPSCTITCDSGYDLDDGECVRERRSSGGGGSRTTTTTITTPVVPPTTPVAPTAPTPYYFTTTMRLGSYAGEVLPLQQFLANQGYYTDTLSGYFGQSTLLAVKAYQRANGLGDDGIVGPMTRAVLNGAQSPTVPSGTTTPTTPVTPTTPTTPTTQMYTYNFGTRLLVNGSRGDDVKELQRFLNKALGLGLVEDGILGPKTIGVIKEWQKSQGLKDDGIVGPQTKAKMLELAKGFK